MCDDLGRGRGEEKRRREPYPFPIRIFVLLICLMQIHTIQPTNSEREYHLDEAEDAVRDVGDCHFAAVEDTHVC